MTTLSRARIAAGLGIPFDQATDERINRGIDRALARHAEKKRAYEGWDPTGTGLLVLRPEPPAPTPPPAITADMDSVDRAFAEHAQADALGDAYLARLGIERRPVEYEVDDLTDEEKTTREFMSVLGRQVPLEPAQRRLLVLRRSALGVEVDELERVLERRVGSSRS